MSNILKIDFLKRQRLSGLLGLTLDGSRLEGVVLRRTNGSVALQQTFSATLSLDPLTADPELVGREIRNQLVAAGIRERRCVLGLPLKWALMTHIKIPELNEADAASFLQIESERSFPCDPATLMVATSRYRAKSGEEHATLIGIPRNHIDILERVLHAAQLKPLSFSLGLTALQPPAAKSSDGVMALEIGDTQVGLQMTGAGGVVALRALEGAIESEGGQRALRADVVAREVRITLGQLPAEFRNQMRRVRIFGPRDLAQQLADELELRLESLDLKTDLAGRYGSGEFGVKIPEGVTVSAAFSLAAWLLAGTKTAFEFLPPKVTAWQELSTRYASGRLRTIGAAAGGVLLLVLGAFMIQQWQLYRLQTKWAQMKPKVDELNQMQDRIRQFRPWYDESVRTLSILRTITTAFPEDGSVYAKTVEIRSPNTVSCSGVAQNNRAFLRVYGNLGTYKEVDKLKVDRIQGRSPMQFTFDFQWVEGGNRAN